MHCLTFLSIKLLSENVIRACYDILEVLTPVAPSKKKCDIFYREWGDGQPSAVRPWQSGQSLNWPHLFLDSQSPLPAWRSSSPYLPDASRSLLCASMGLIASQELAEALWKPGALGTNLLRSPTSTGLHGPLHALLLPPRTPSRALQPSTGISLACLFSAWFSQRTYWIPVFPNVLWEIWT